MISCGCKFMTQLQLDVVYLWQRLQHWPTKLLWLFFCIIAYTYIVEQFLNYISRCWIKSIYALLKYRDSFNYFFHPINLESKKTNLSPALPQSSINKSNCIKTHFRNNSTDATCKKNLFNFPTKMHFNAKLIIFSFYVNRHRNDIKIL